MTAFADDAGNGAGMPGWHDDHQYHVSRRRDAETYVLVVGLFHVDLES